MLSLCFKRNVIVMWYDHDDSSGLMSNILTFYLVEKICFVEIWKQNIDVENKTK